jgi:N-acyl-D-amino-acid deacylase
MTGLLLKGGTVFDGLGTPGRIADVAVAEGRVAAVGGDPPPGLRTIDCTGLYVTPGFVDSHAHSDLIHLLEAPQPFKLLQGVTTEVVGNCGLTFAPLDHASAPIAGTLWSWLAGGAPVEPSSFAELADRLDAAIPANNLALLVGHGTLRLTANGMAGRLLERLAAARLDGVDAQGDQYPYDAGATVLSTLLPPAVAAGGTEAMLARLRDPAARAQLRAQAERGGVGDGTWAEADPGDVLLTSHRDAGVVGRTLAEAAGARDPWETLCDLVADDPGAGIVIRLMHEDDVRAIMASPIVGVGSDSGPPTGLEHPRTWGCFPRLLGRYVRELGLLTWEQAVRKATWLGARQFRLDGRGVLLEGAVADLCVLDPATVGHQGTYLDPDVPVTGIRQVVLGGDLVVEDGRFTGVRAGRVLRRGGSSPPGGG